MAEAAELVFIPLPVMGHLPSTIETARNLVARFDDARQISVTILIMKFPSLDNTIDSFIQSLKPDSTGRFNILELPGLETPPDVTSNYFLRDHMEAYKPVIRQTLLQKTSQYHSPGTQQQQALTRGCRKLAGFVLDMCCTTMIDVAKELGSPSYIFYAPSALCLSLTLQLAYHGVPDITVAPSTGQSSPLINDESTAAVPEPGPVVEVPGLRNPLPAKLCPDVFLDKDSGWGQTLLECARRFKETKGILLNTFSELESDLIKSQIRTCQHGQDKIVANILPPVYPIGPMVNLNKDLATNKIDKRNQIMSWLDAQPLSSVVFLCFGSSGAFQENQVNEIAAGLEQSGQRFLWSLRRTPSSSTFGSSGMRPPEEFDDFKDVLPKGFLARTARVGKVIGWAPQASVLAHKAVGAFVTHCGWNSILESLWFGVPLVAWPMYAEQQVNAFELVVELGLAAEIRMDYKFNFQREANVFVGADVIENAIRKVMEEEGLREKTKHISQVAKKSLEAGGSSYKSMGCFLEDVFKNQS